MSISDNLTQEEAASIRRLLDECERLAGVLGAWLDGDPDKEPVAYAMVGVEMACKRFRTLVGSDEWERAKSIRLAEFYPEVNLLGPGWRKEDLPI